MNLLSTAGMNNPAGAMWRLAHLSLLAGGVALFTGCGSYPESHVVSAPPPAAPVQQVVVAPAQTQPATVPVAVQTTDGTIIITQAPPVAQQEAAQARPSANHVWVPGYWTWRNNRYEWMPGRWIIPPHPNATWVSPRWERLGDGTYRFYEGHWN